MLIFCNEILSEYNMYINSLYFVLISCTILVLIMHIYIKYRIQSWCHTYIHTKIHEYILNTILLLISDYLGSAAECRSSYWRYGYASSAEDGLETGRRSW